MSLRLYLKGYVKEMTPPVILISGFWEPRAEAKLYDGFEGETR